MNLDAIRGEDEILRVLRAAQERIRDPENWGKHALYEHGRLCARGALAVSVGIAVERLDCTIWENSFFLSADKYLVIAARKAGFICTADLNNKTDHLTTLAMFDRAQELRLADMMEAAVA